MEVPEPTHRDLPPDRRRWDAARPFDVGVSRRPRAGLAFLRTVDPVPDPEPVDPLALRRRDGESRWYVLHTRSRQEKALDASLHGMGIDSWLPLCRVERRCGPRRRTTAVPLFPGYLFLWGSRDEVFLADRTRRVAGLIDVRDQARLEWELSNVNRALLSGASLDPFPAVQRGLRVRIVSGPFQGVEGIVASRDAADRLVLQVRILNTAASLDIDGALVEPLDL